MFSPSLILVLWHINLDLFRFISRVLYTVIQLLFKIYVFVLSLFSCLMLCVHDFSLSSWSVLQKSVHFIALKKTSSGICFFKYTFCYIFIKSVLFVYVYFISSPLYHSWIECLFIFTLSCLVSKALQAVNFLLIDLWGYPVSICSIIVIGF